MKAEFVSVVVGLSFVVPSTYALEEGGVLRSHGRGIEELVHGEVVDLMQYDLSDLIVFGDSLADNGNLASVLSSVPERFSNGIVAAEHFAECLGFEVRPSLFLTESDALGTNYAVSGARCMPPDEATADTSEEASGVPPIPAQVNAYLGSVSDSVGVPHADPNALYVIFGGGNDILDAFRKTATGESAHDVITDLHRAAASCLSSAKALIDAGAQYIMQIGGVDIGDIPRITLIQDDSVVDVAKDLSMIFNSAMDRETNVVEKDTGIDIVTVDISVLAQNADESGLQLDEPCQINFGIPEANPPIVPMAPFKTCVLPDADGFVFFDEIHPTTVAHKMIAVEMLQTLLRTTLRNKNFPYVSPKY